MILARKKKQEGVCKNPFFYEYAKHHITNVVFLHQCQQQDTSPSSSSSVYHKPKSKTVDNQLLIFHACYPLSHGQ
jgi:hypothetical protein